MSGIITITIIIIIISSMSLVDCCCLHEVPPVSTILCSSPRGVQTNVDRFQSDRFQQFDSMSVLVVLEVVSTQQEVLELRHVEHDGDPF